MNNGVPICKDIIHDNYRKLSKYNYMGNFLLFFQLSLATLIVISNARPPNKIIFILLSIWIFLMIFRLIIYKCTSCNINSLSLKQGDKTPQKTKNPLNKRKPIWGCDRWYIISGHTVSTIILSFLIMNSSIHYSIKILSILLSICIIVSQVITKEHKTVDVIITFFLTYFMVSYFLLKNN